jgi:hypothetical protein
MGPALEIGGPKGRHKAKSKRIENVAENSAFRILTPESLNAF